MRSIYENPTLMLSAASGQRASDDMYRLEAAARGLKCRMPWRTGSPASVSVSLGDGLFRNIGSSKITKSPPSKAHGATRSRCYRVARCTLPRRR